MERRERKEKEKILLCSIFLVIVEQKCPIWSGMGIHTFRSSIVTTPLLFRANPRVSAGRLPSSRQGSILVKSKFKGNQPIIKSI